MAHSSDAHVHLHPLLLPEVLNVLGSFLQRKSLLCSLQVCKTWHRALEPQLWHTVSTARKSIFPFKVPAHTLTLMPHSKSDTLPEALLRNLPHIRGIYFGDQDSQDHHHHPSSAPSDLKSLLLQCRNLTTLQLNNLSDEMMTLLEYNLNTIQRIVYHSNSFKVLRQKPLWDILDSMPRLRHLELKHVNIGAKNSSQGEAFVKICERLEAMHLIICTLGDWPSFEQGQPGRFPKMKQLEFMFVNEPYTQLQMIRQCPVLEDLTCRSDSSFPTQDFIHYLCLTRSTSCLKRLNLQGCAIFDADSAAIIAQLPASCNQLTFDNSDFGALFITALAEAPLRRDLSLTLIHGIPSHLAHGLLSRCPNLQYLLPFCEVIATDLLTAPWVASRLVKLELTLLSVTHLPPEFGHSGIYEQLSRLVSLQELCLHEKEISDRLGYGRLGLDFSLESGMGVLASLTQLRRLDLRALQVLRMDQAEALWMTTHWPALTSLDVGWLNRNIRLHDKMLEFLGQRRPELDISSIY